MRHVTNRRFFWFSLCLLLYCLLPTTPLSAQSAPVQLWRVEFTDTVDLNRLAAELDVWEVDHAARRILVPLTADEAATLSQTHTLTLSPDQSPLALPQASTAQAGGIPGFACYRTVDETFATQNQLVADYPELVQLVDIGNSWDKDNAGDSVGDDLRVLVITNHAIAGPKFRFMLMSAIHAREYTTAELALRFAESLVKGYGADAEITWLLDHGELHLLTAANPDGRRIAETGVLWRKNTHLDACTNYGVDLNRNSSFKWNECEGFSCSSSDSCSLVYRGATPASEPEVSAIESYLQSIFADQRGEAIDAAAPESTPGLFISLHSYGRLVLFPWGYTTTHAPNAHGLATLARRLGYPLNNTLCQAGGAGCLYQTDGTTDDFAYGDLGVASFTIELGTSFFQSCSYFEDAILQQGLAALRYAFSAAPRPYELAQGPEVLHASVQQQRVGVQQRVTISATADATRIAVLSGSGISSITEPIDRIHSARLTIDELPWASGAVTHTFAPVDGTFNSVQEAITATVDIACLPHGRHTLHIQAQDDQGDWGIVTAAFVTVTNTSPFTLTLPSAQAETKAGDPVTFTVHLTNTSTTTETFTVDPSRAAEVAVVPSRPITLTAGASAAISAIITPQKNTAGTIVPAVIVVRSLSNPSNCRQVTLATSVVGWPYQQRLLWISQN